IDGPYGGPRPRQRGDYLGVFDDDDSLIRRGPAAGGPLVFSQGISSTEQLPPHVARQDSMSAGELRLVSGSRKNILHDELIPGVKGGVNVSVILYIPELGGKLSVSRLPLDGRDKLLLGPDVIRTRPQIPLAL